MSNTKKQASTSKAKQDQKLSIESVIELCDPVDDPENILCYMDTANLFLNMLSAFEEEDNDKVYKAVSNASIKDIASLQLVLSFIKTRLDRVIKDETLYSIISDKDLCEHFIKSLEDH